MRVDFSDADDSRIDAGLGLPPFKHVPCRIVDAEFRSFGEGDDRYLNFAVQVAEGEQQGKIATFDKLFFHTEGARDRSFFALKQFGLSEEQLRAPDFELEPEMVEGRLALVTTVYEYQCGEQDCYGVARRTGASDDGKPVYECCGTKNVPSCGWRGVNVIERTKVAFSGYRAVDGEAGPGDAEGPSGESIPF